MFFNKKQCEFSKRIGEVVVYARAVLSPLDGAAFVDETLREGQIVDVTDEAVNIEGQWIMKEFLLFKGTPSNYKNELNHKWFQNFET